MIYIKYLTNILMLAAMFLVGCSNLVNVSEKNPPNIIYENAKQNIKNKNWKQAITQLEALNQYCSYNSYLQPYIQLYLIYAYYKNDNLLLAQTTIDHYMRFNPTSINTDYVIYMHGLISMALDYNISYSILGIDHSDRDPQYAYDAFVYLSELVHYYPNSKYVIDAIKRLIFLKNRLAKYEYAVASYYADRHAWIAVVNRVEDMLHNYPDTLATRNGLDLMERAYRQMKMNYQADKVAKIISVNNNIDYTIRIQ